MIKRILVPTDFSNCSINALRYAVQLAKKIRSEEILIMHATVAGEAYDEEGVTLVSKKTAWERKEEIKAGFELIKKAVPELQDINYTTRTQHASLIDALISLSISSNIDLIVMGTTGASGIDKVIYGTNAYTTIKECNCPVLVIPEKATFKHIKHIIMASDFKQMDEGALEPLKTLSQLFGSTISIVHVDGDKKLANDKAEEAKKFERYFKNINHRYHFIENDDVEKGLNEYIRKYNTDLLTLVPRKHPLYDQVFGGGDSKSIIFHTKIPLLAIPETL
ncbi:universal stress protein [Fulvivirga sp.]|uniref:universal stress protein n=1 Tax=Fulvivirga sp. TaxID=1931237 RepID=UPI0032EAD100